MRTMSVSSARKSLFKIVAGKRPVRLVSRSQVGYYMPEAAVEKIQDDLDEARADAMERMVKKGLARTMTSKQLLRYLGV